MRLLVETGADRCEQCPHLDYREPACRLFMDDLGDNALLTRRKDGWLVRCRQCRDAEKKARER